MSPTNAKEIPTSLGKGVSAPDSLNIQNIVWPLKGLDQIVSCNIVKRDGRVCLLFAAITKSFFQGLNMCETRVFSSKLPMPTSETTFSSTF